MVRIKSDSRNSFGVAVRIDTKEFAFGDTEADAIAKLVAKIRAKKPNMEIEIESWHDGVFVPLADYNPNVKPDWLNRAEGKEVGNLDQ